MKTPYEEIAGFSRQGLKVVDHGDRIAAYHPVLGQMYCRPKAILDRRTREVELERATLEFAFENHKAFADWYGSTWLAGQGRGAGCPEG